MAMSIRGFLRNNLKFLSSSILKPVSNNGKISFCNLTFAFRILTALEPRGNSNPTLLINRID